MIILLAGLPGTGKTTLARNLSSRTGGIVLNKDEVRAALFPPEAIEYTTGQDDFVMSKILESAVASLRERPEQLIFLDGRPFAKKYQIDQVLTVASALKQSVRILLCVCSEETAKTRLAHSDGHPAGNRDFALYLRMKASFEEITAPHAVINTDQPQELSIEQALASLTLRSL